MKTEIDLPDSLNERLQEILKRTHCDKQSFIESAIESHLKDIELAESASRVLQSKERFYTTEELLADLGFSDDRSSE